MTPQGKEYSNIELAAIFERIANLLQIKGEDQFRVRSYQRAAESLRSLSEDAQLLYSQGKLLKVPGIGKAIGEKIEELLTTGKLQFLERLESEIPPTLLELLEVQDVGPRKAALFWKQVGVTNLAQLEAAAREGKLRSLPGMGAKSEARIIAGIEAYGRRTDRMTLGYAWEQAEHWLEWLREQPETHRAEVGGSLRRQRETIGDLDLIVTSDNPVPLMERFIHHPKVSRIRGEGENKASIELEGGLNIQIWVQPPSRFGSLWVYATGGKLHNVRLREIALKKGLSLSERGMEDGDGKLIEFDSEEAIYKKLGLPLIPPELREDRGEIEAALKNALPKLIEVQDLLSELHTHSTWSDGSLSVEDMANAAIQQGIKVLAITDHSASLGIVRGMKVEDVHAQREEIQKVQKKLDGKIRLLQGSEVEILADGRLDYPDEVLAELDIVIASLHTSLRQPKETVTARLLHAIQNPHVDVIGHPSGRLLPNREGADLDWDTVLTAAKQSGVALEINADPHRLDLNDVHSRRAVEMGIPLTINTDAHAPDGFRLNRFGIAVARRAWVQPENVINTWPEDKLIDWLKNR